MSDVAALLAPLVALRSDQPHADERPLARHLEAQLFARGANEVVLCEVPRPGAHGAYVLARWGRPRLLLNAHLDTVPPNEGWTGDPFTARRSDEGGGRTIGLGACDTKGAIAAILAALDAARPTDLAVLFSGDEEHGGTCLRAFIEGPLRAPGGAAAEVERAIVFEPTSCRVGTRHRGVLAIEARLAGRGGHSSRADALPQPLADLARVAAAWSDWGRARATSGPPGFPGLCFNVARLDGGVAFNVVPDEARLLCSLRPPPGADAAALRDELCALARAVCPAATFTFPVDHPPFATADLEAFAALGFAPAAAPPIDLAFWTEAATLAEAGIDAVVYGPGDIARAHAPDEFVPHSELTQVRDTLAALIRTLRS